MRRLLALTTLLALSAGAQTLTGTQTAEVLVLTTATTIPAYANRRAIEIQNLGPNTIYCALGATPVTTKARAILAAGAWALDVGEGITIKCIAAAANQTTGAATIVTQVR